MQYVMLIATFCIQVPFFSDDEETPSSTPKADALFIPRENPRSLVIRPIEQWPMRASVEKASPLKESTSVHENGNLLIAFSARLDSAFSAESCGAFFLFFFWHV